MENPLLTIVTPTTGDKHHLKKCIQSVQNQSCKDFKHLIIVDGEEEFGTPSKEVISECDITSVKTQVLVLPENTGKDNWYGHRIYGASTFLVNTPWIQFLDQDNSIEPNHVETVLETIASDDKLDFCWCRRNIVDEMGNLRFKDQCESLGTGGSIWKGLQNGAPLKFLDSNCWIWRREFLMKFVNIWYNKGYQYPPTDPDRMFSFYLLNDLGQKIPNTNKSTNHYTLNYTLDDPARIAYFEEGHEFMKKLS